MNKILEEYYEARQKHDDALGKLEEETQRIVDVIRKVFKMGKDKWWSFKYYHDSDDDEPLPQSLEDDGLTFHIFIEGTADSGEWSYNNGFPVKFFDMTDEDVESYIRKEIDVSKKKKEKDAETKKNKLEARKKKKESLIAAAAEKLTDEEKKALGI